MKYDLDLLNTKNLLDFLDKNSLIEASAGTGKTHTIIELVKTLILEKEIKPENILIVTFTEKAAGELKERISKKLEEIINLNTQDKKNELAKNAFNNINRFEINTIHGFCYKIIKDFPFEIGYPFENKIVNNEDIVRDSFYRYLRKDIFKDFKDEIKLKKLLEIIGFLEENTESKIENILTYILRISYLFPLNLEVYSEEEILSILDSLYLNIEELKERIKDEKINSKTKKSILDKLNRIKDTNNKLEVYENIQDIRENVIQEIDEYILRFNNLKNLFINYIAQRTLSHTKKFKKDNALITFDDMIHNVYKALKENKRFVEILQNKYIYGFIDEFQDTDFIQWKIFKRIFIESPKNRIILIGDPKQSIYSFRNADINTYFEAKKEIEKNGYIANLNTNYRSIKQLVNCYNKIFSENNFFLSDKIFYNSVIANPKKYEADQKCIGLYLKELETKKSNDKQREFLFFIRDEILRLINGKRFLIKKKEEKEFRPPKLNEIAILVSSRSDAKKIQEFLTQHNIESTIYKKSLLFQSDEAIQVLYLIDYLTEQNNIQKLKKLLLTDFFFIPNEINLDEYIKDKKVVEFVKKSKEIIENNKLWTLFSKLFKILELEQNIIKKYSFDRMRIITNYRQIAEILEKMAYKEQLDIYSLKYRLISLIYKDKTDEIEEDLYRLDSDSSKVNILTIHISKGLEYPIVFDYGALKNINKKRKRFYYFDEEKKNYIFEFEPQKNIKDKIEKLDFEEYRRLHYVAITRAIVASYLPVLNSKKSNENEISIAEMLYNLKENFKENFIISERDDECLKDLYKVKDYNQKKEVQEKDLSSINRAFTIQSFSSIHMLEKTEKESVESLINTINDENYNKDSITLDLPKGKNTGSFLHKILEEIDYTKDLETKEVNKIIEENTNFFFRFEDNNIRKDYTQITKKLISNLLNHHISEIGIKLREIKKEDRINEMEFYFSVDENFINGSIDLVFRYNDKYYIVDWKSNSVEGSCEPHFKENYELQAKIYEYAFVKHLEKVIKEFNYDKYFGGIFFIYLRSIDKDGIVYIKPDKNRYKNLLNEFKQKLDRLNEFTKDWYYFREQRAWTPILFSKTPY